jgi:hypothetical protein
VALRLFFNSARNPFIRNAFFNQSLRGFPCAFSANRRALKINSISSKRFAYLEAAAWKNTGFFNQLPSRLSNPQKRDFRSIADSEEKPTFEEYVKLLEGFEEFKNSYTCLTDYKDYSEEEIKRIYTEICKAQYNFDKKVWEGRDPSRAF